ncbi:U-box domain-containing protein 8 isoform X2 [Selaginella moellendorffii]|nr:U-box domain-containing protein 8 isoform X2 [Selaginella moellendorffii]|eukprot:XP_024514850.1 U-box domain-containing protein 8 isoform X2 [Selaginella moellendorffii]
METSSQGIPAPPEDFRCPISLEVMAEPVILWTGQTYDRQSIQRWLDSGHTTCPKTKQELHDDTRLIPNYALRSLIQSWAAANSVELASGGGGASGGGSKSKKSSICSSDSSSNRARKEAVEALVRGILAANPASLIRDSVRELRILAKESRPQRAMICEAGGVAKLLDLLLGKSRPAFPDLQNEIEENAVVALLNLCADDENKVGLVAEGAVDAILHILSRHHHQASIDTRASAALAITSLAMVDVNKAIIGRHPGAMPGLVRLLSSGSPRGKKDAAIALYSLCMLPDNRRRAVAAGVVSVLLTAVENDARYCAAHLAAPAEGEAVLALLDVLATCPEGRAEMRLRRGVVPALVRVMGAAGDSAVPLRARESCAAVLYAVCCEDATWTAIARDAGAAAVAGEMARGLNGECRAARKAASLVQLLSA